LSRESPVLRATEEVGLAVRPGEAGVEVAREAIPILVTRQSFKKARHKSTLVVAGKMSVFSGNT